MAEIHSETNISNENPSNDAMSSFSPQENKTSEAIGPTASDGVRLHALCLRLLSALPPEEPRRSPDRPADLLAAALFLLMVDGGFVPAGEAVESSGPRGPRLPDDWKTARPGTYSAEFTLPHFSDYSCRLVASPLGDHMLVNCVSSESVSAYSACLSIRRYVSRESEITDCGGLSLEVKDCVISPTRSAALSVRGIANASLTGLPKELLVRILLLLEPRDVCRVSATCRLLKTVARDEIVWQHFYNRKYSKTRTSGSAFNSLSWFDLYKECHEEQVTLRKKSKGYGIFRADSFTALSWVGEFLKEI